jgi:DNA-binding transcriptional ArsR family regulator
LASQNKQTETGKSIDELIAFVVRHPIRVDALAVLNERVASPSEIAVLIGENVSKVGHHIKELFEAGCLELVKEETVRGAIEHFYRPSLRPNISDAEWAKLSDESRAELSGLVFQAIMAEGLGALRADTFDSRLNRHLSWRVVNVDEQGFNELANDKAESLVEVERIEARSDGRKVESGEKGLSVIVAAMVFERARPGRSPRPPLSG